jgi:5,10-methylenetetrahydromethanopterin reductase
MVGMAIWELSVTAAAIPTVQAQSDGCAVLGIGRGDSALAFLGRGPVTVNEFERALSVLLACGARSTT